MICPVSLEQRILVFTSKTTFLELLVNTTTRKPEMPNKRATGVGGIFFKVKDPEKTRDWYKEHLGFNTDQYGTNFEWREADEGTEKGFTQWSPFKSDSDYFAGDFMINYRVENIDELLEELKAKGVEIVSDVTSEDYGKFVHIIDGDGQRVELWEPNNRYYDEMVGEGRTK
jgi:catechol 2,3-dioxygenase-like lactoylglutathione lyase family enzyme